MRTAANFVDLTGQRFGKRLVLKRESNRVYNGKQGNSRWLVKCDCGKENIVDSGSLKKAISCGCDKAGAIRSGLSRRNNMSLKSQANKAHLKNTFGLSLEDFRNLVTAQDNKCAICKKEFSRTPHIDHDHSCCPSKKSCGKCIRGLLCHKCNTALGNFGDDVELLKRAADYLKQPNKVELQII